MAQEYDVTLKLLLREPFQRAVGAVMGLSIAKWLDAELPMVQNPRVDLLGETAEGELLHLELQVRPDSEMPLRMAQYALGIRRSWKRFARQVVLYVGDSSPGMSTSLMGPGFFFEYQLIHLRDLDGEALLASDQVSDNILAIVTNLKNREEAVIEIVRKISDLEETERGVAVQQLVILAGLRGLKDVVEEEIAKMPTIHELVIANNVLGLEYKRGHLEGELKGELRGKLEGKREGMLEGKLEGKLEGRLEGELTMVRRLIEKRFGPIPEWAEARIAGQSLAVIEALGLRVLDARNLDELLGRL